MPRCGRAWSVLRFGSPRTPVPRTGRTAQSPFALPAYISQRFLFTIERAAVIMEVAMTDHQSLKMNHEERRISDKQMLMKILDMERTCFVALHDDPYPYVVPMNYGWVWEDQLIFYMHMAVSGHRIELIRRNPKVAVAVGIFLDRAGYRPYRSESHDYRSVMAYGTASILTPDSEEEFLRGISVLCRHTGRPEVKKLTKQMREKMLILKITADYVSGKSQYPVSSPEEVEMPPLAGFQQRGQGT